LSFLELRGAVGVLGLSDLKGFWKAVVEHFDVQNLGTDQHGSRGFDPRFSVVSWSH
jgi:hypothetical protein